MIIKNFEIKNINISKFNFFLFYGKNDGLKNELIENFFLKDFKGKILNYEESEFINNKETLVSEMLNISLFENNKIIIISRASDKITSIIEEISEKNISELKIILKAGLLEKRSRLRSFFEKSKYLVTIPFYEEDIKNLTTIITNFIAKNKINISRESINLIAKRCSGDRKNLVSELDKILSYSISNKSINFETIEKITNLAENYNMNELANNYLSKDKKNISKILNENNFSDDDCVLIIRTILNKLKRLISIIERYNETNNIDEVISKTKPPIFWKEKEIVKNQVRFWVLEELKSKMYEINEIETLIKSNTRNSLNIVSDFVVNC